MTADFGNFLSTNGFVYRVDAADIFLCLRTVLVPFLLLVLSSVLVLIEYIQSYIQSFRVGGVAQR